MALSLSLLVTHILFLLCRIQTQSQTVTVSVTLSKPLKNVTNFFFTVVACVKKRHDTTPTVPLGEGIRYFMRATVVPKHPISSGNSSSNNGVEDDRRRVTERLSAFVPRFVRQDLQAKPMPFRLLSSSGIVVSSNMSGSNSGNNNNNNNSSNLANSGSNSASGGSVTGSSREGGLASSTLITSAGSSSSLQRSVPLMSTVLPSEWIPRAQPAIESFNATVLVLDISGLANSGSLSASTAEQLATKLNSFIGSLIEIVEQNGGDVLRFTGQSLICMFGDHRHADRTQVNALRAVRCALQLQAQAASASDGLLQESLGIGLGSGYVHSLYIGGVGGSWEFVVVGEPFLQLEALRESSVPLQIVASNQCWHLVSQACVGEARGTDWIIMAFKDDAPSLEALTIEPLAVSPQAEAALRCYVPKAIQSQIDSMQDWYPQMVQVTALVMKLAGITYLPGKTFDWYAVHKVLCYLQLVVFRYEGMVHQYSVSDQGIVLIALFGMPPVTHAGMIVIHSIHSFRSFIHSLTHSLTHSQWLPDDALRGLKSAIEIHEELKNQNLQNSIGVATGTVICASVGASSRQDYAMVRDSNE